MVLLFPLLIFSSYFILLIMAIRILSVSQAWNLSGIFFSFFVIFLFLVTSDNIFILKNSALSVVKLCPYPPSASHTPIVLTQTLILICNILIASQFKTKKGWKYNQQFKIRDNIQPTLWIREWFSPNWRPEEKGRNHQVIGFAVFLLSQPFLVQQNKISNRKFSHYSSFPWRYFLS